MPLQTYCSAEQIGRDLFDNFDLWAQRVTPTVYACGSGPSLIGALPKLNPGHYSIALNGAITLAHNWHCWTVFDAHAAFWPWYHTGFEVVDKYADVLLGHRLEHERANWYYQVTSKKPHLEWGSAPGGCTVAGCAIALAFHALKRNGYQDARIVLAGVDMYGSEHASGETGMQSGQWGQTDKLRTLCEMVQSEGIPMYTFKENKLGLELWQG